MSGPGVSSFQGWKLLQSLSAGVISYMPETSASLTVCWLPVPPAGTVPRFWL